MVMTQHAKARISQRGIPFNAVECIFLFGESSSVPGDAEGLRLSRKEGQALIKDCHRLIRSIECAIRGVQTIVGGECVITVERCNRRRQRNAKRKGYRHER